MASLVQDVWLAWGPRLRARRLAPWTEPAVRLLFCPDQGATLDDPPLAVFLESLARRLEVIAWEPRGQGASAGRPGPEVLDDARRLVLETPSRWGGDPILLVGGHGQGAWIALAIANQPGVAGAFALAPALRLAPGAEPPPLPEVLLAALERPPLTIPTLVIQPRCHPEAEQDRCRKWVAREPLASRVASASADLLGPPWDDVVRAWTESVGTGGRTDP
jgi:Serine aminopeptidase, S33